MGDEPGAVRDDERRALERLAFGRDADSERGRAARDRLDRMAGSAPFATDSTPPGSAEPRTAPVANGDTETSDGGASDGAAPPRPLPGRRHTPVAVIAAVALVVFGVFAGWSARGAGSWTADAAPPSSPTPIPAAEPSRADALAGAALTPADFLGVQESDGYRVACYRDAEDQQPAVIFDLPSSSGDQAAWSTDPARACGEHIKSQSEYQYIESAVATEPPSTTCGSIQLAEQDGGRLYSFTKQDSENFGWGEGPPLPPTDGTTCAPVVVLPAMTPIFDHALVCVPRLGGGVAVIARTSPEAVCPDDSITLPSSS